MVGRLQPRTLEVDVMEGGKLHLLFDPAKKPRLGGGAAVDPFGHMCINDEDLADEADLVDGEGDAIDGPPGGLPDGEMESDGGTDLDPDELQPIGMEPVLPVPVDAGACITVEIPEVGFIVYYEKKNAFYAYCGCMRHVRSFGNLADPHGAIKPLYCRKNRTAVASAKLGSGRPLGWLMTWMMASDFHELQHHHVMGNDEFSLVARS